MITFTLDIIFDNSCLSIQLSFVYAYNLMQFSMCNPEILW